MGGYCEVYRGPERVQVLQVNVPLIYVEVWTSAYLVQWHKSIAVARVEDSVWPKGLWTWVIDVTQHGNVSLGNNVTN